MTPTQRLAFGAVLKELRTTRFEGSRKAAYGEAGVNPATWTRAEAGESIKEQSLTKIVTNLFPRTRGDWTKLLDTDGNFVLTYWDINGLHPDDAGSLERALGVARDEKDQVADWASTTAALQDLREKLGSIELRLELLEQHLGVDPFPGLSVVPGEVPDAVAAHEEEGSIAGEQEESDTP